MTKRIAQRAVLGRTTIGSSEKIALCMCLTDARHK